MKLLLEFPASYSKEREYAASVLLNEFLGLETEIRHADISGIKISCGDGKALRIADGLFAVEESGWLSLSSLPKLPLQSWDIASCPLKTNIPCTSVPVIYGKNPAVLDFFIITDKKIELGLDIFGSCFFMLTRYEESVKADRDGHDRFPAEASLAVQAEFSDRPIVNEYLEILWACLKHLWPRLSRRSRTYELELSHDVDYLFHIAGRPLPQAVARLGGDLLKRKSPSLAFRSAVAYAQSMAGRYDGDPGNCFDFIMDVSERHGLASTFYFMADSACPGDECRGYRGNEQHLSSLMRHIHARGHKIGLHPNYNSYRDSAQTKKEFEAFLSIAEKAGVAQRSFGGRQHYLRWSNPETWQNYADSGLVSDSSLGYEDRTGFRCGVCYEYPVFNLKTRQCLKLTEKPLLVMEGVFYHMQASCLDPAAQEKIAALNRVCRHYAGACSLLWHNSSLLTAREKRGYFDMVASLLVESSK